MLRDPFFRSPLMWDPIADASHVHDPFDVFQNDPFFNPYLRQQRLGGPRQQQQQLLGDDMNKDNTALTGPSTVGTTGANTQLAPVDQNQNVGFWNFNRFLNEPLSLGLEEQNDKYVMNVVKPAHIGDHDLKIDINNDILTVHGEKKEQREDKGSDGKQKSYYSSYSTFSRSIKLPQNVDQSKIAANMMEPGKLVIDLPKKPQQEQKKLKEIPISKRT